MFFHKEDPQEVLASWLFTQYLLTSDVQISYSETEGYVPVTSKAQESAEYQDYLAREGEDADTHYKVKTRSGEAFVKSYAGLRLQRPSFPARLPCGMRQDR